MTDLVKASTQQSEDTKEFQAFQEALKAFKMYEIMCLSGQLQERLIDFNKVDARSSITPHSDAAKYILKAAISRCARRLTKKIEVLNDLPEDIAQYINENAMELNRFLLLQAERYTQQMQIVRERLDRELEQAERRLTEAEAIIELQETQNMVISRPSR